MDTVMSTAAGMENMATATERMAIRTKNTGCTAIHMKVSRMKSTARAMAMLTGWKKFTANTAIHMKNTVKRMKCTVMNTRLKRMAMRLIHQCPTTRPIIMMANTLNMATATVVTRLMARRMN